VQRALLGGLETPLSQTPLPQPNAAPLSQTPLPQPNATPSAKRHSLSQTPLPQPNATPSAKRHSPSAKRHSLSQTPLPQPGGVAGGGGVARAPSHAGVAQGPFGAGPGVWDRGSADGGLRADHAGQRLWLTATLVKPRKPPRLPAPTLASSPPRAGGMGGAVTALPLARGRDPPPTLSGFTQGLAASSEGGEALPSSARGPGGAGTAGGVQAWRCRGQPGAVQGLEVQGAAGGTGVGSDCGVDGAWSRGWGG